jgi:hypothetical protein
LRVFTTYQAATVVTNHGYKKIRPMRTQGGEYRYEVKGLTDADYQVFEDEDLTPQEVEELLEPGGWVILDAYSASGIKQVYEALNADNQARFDRIPLDRIVQFAFSR